MRQTILTVVVALLAACGVADVVTIDRAFLEDLTPCELHLENASGVAKLFVGDQNSDERLVQNFLSAGRIGDQQYYFFDSGSGTAQERILAVEHPDDKLIAVYDYHEGYSELSVDYGILAYVTPFGQLAPALTFHVIDLSGNVMKLQKELRFDRRPVPGVDTPVFNYVEPRITFGSHDRGGVFVRLAAVQAHYVISEHVYWVDHDLLLASAVGKSDHIDFARTNVVLTQMDALWLIESVDIATSVPSGYFDDEPVTAVVSRHGDTAVVTGTVDPSLWVFRAESTGPVKYHLSDYFSYADPITDIQAGAWVDSEVTVIIDTVEFNYDFVFDLDDEEAESFLRTSEYDRFVR